MDEMNLHSIRNNAKKSYKIYSIEVNRDRLYTNFKVSRPNEAWVGDITSYKFVGKFYYICVIIDLYARKVVAYKISKKLSTQLTTATLKKSYEQRQPQSSLIFHSDRGSQYTSHSFQDTLRKLGVEQSLSPIGRPQHNAVMESFFSPMKEEELYRRKYKSERELYDAVDRYITFYNTEHPHATLKYKSPCAFEELYTE